MIMQFTAKSVYGQTKIYPACVKSQAYADAIGVKTLNEHQLECARRMGFETYLDGKPSLSHIINLAPKGWALAETSVGV